MKIRCGIVVMLSALMLLGLVSAASARDYKIIADGQANYFDLSLSKLAVSFQKSVSLDEQKAILTALPAVSTSPIERYEAPLNMTIVRLRDKTDEKGVLATLAALEAMPQVEWSAPALMYDGLEHVPTPRLYVQFASGMNAAAEQSVLSQFGLTLLRHCDDWAKDVVYVQRAKGTGVESLDICTALSSRPDVLWAEPDFNRQANLCTNDTYYANQWYLYQPSRHDIHAPEAWAVTTGDTSVIISICDVGVQIAHPDLAGHIVTGYDAVDGDNDPTPNTTYQDDGHGTCCAGIAAAVTNNGVGVAGVAYNCRLMGTRMGYISFGGSGIQTNDTWIINCINYSRDHAKVCSNSWGGGSTSSPVNTALQNAKNAGLTILFASGNSNTSVQWPATQSSVIAVGATNEIDYRCSPSDWGSGQGSNYGSQLDVVAPGNNQYCTDDSRTGAGFSSGAYFATFAGTSGACPVAAGVCGLILSRNSSYPPDSVQAILQRTANDQVGNPSEDVAGWDQYMGWGRVNAQNAVNAAAGLIVTSPNGGETWYTGESHNITWTSAGVTGNVKIEINRTYPGGAWETIIASTANNGTYAWTVTAPATSTARIRISSVSVPAINDVSGAEFNIVVSFAMVLSPNGGEIWYVGDSHLITWTSGGFTGNVKIELNRSYSGGAWEVLFASTANDGSEPWTVTGTSTSSLCRIRVTSVNLPSISDVSDANFTVAMPTITVLTPNGGEIWSINFGQNITWVNTGLSGNVNIELNRTYPSGGWELLFSNTPNDSIQEWVATGPTTTQARIRITSVNNPLVTDVSDNNFTIQGMPPVLLHDPLDDFTPGSGTITAISYSSALLSIQSVHMYYRLVGATPFLSLNLSATGNPNEYAASLASLAAGSYEYYVESTDNVSLTSRVPAGAPASLYTFTVGVLTPSELSYDDGSAEWFNYPGADSVAIQWAVKFGPVAPPFALFGARFAVSRSLPDTVHTPVSVKIYLADGAGGLPGTLVASYVKGSIGNDVGGVPLGTNWAHAIFSSPSGIPLQINSSEFYVAVSNIQYGKIEAFGRDTNGANNHHSYFYDPCRESWFSEDDVASDTLAHPGNRLIRVEGYGLIPPTVVINCDGTNVKLYWSNVGAPAYNVYSSATVGGPFTFVQSTTDTFLTVSAANDLSVLRQFYQVKSATP
jgi:thermitase